MNPFQKAFLSAMIATGLVMTIATMVFISTCVPDVKYPKPPPPDEPE